LKMATEEKPPAPPPAKLKPGPEPLQYFWDAETADAWRKFTPKQKEFFLEWVRNGYNGTKAAKAVYGEYKTEGSARAAASAILAKHHVMRVRKQIVATPNWDLELAHQTFIDAMHSPSINDRLAGARGHLEAYEKMKGRQLAPEPEKNNQTNITNVQQNINIIVTKSIDNVKHLLNNPWTDE